MQNQRKLLFLNTVILCLVFFVVGCGKSDVEKAQEFMADGMYPQAMELLSKRIAEKPNDATAHFLMGSCQINTGNLSEAGERFASAVRLQSDYGFKIGSEYKKAGFEASQQAKTTSDIGESESRFHFEGQTSSNQYGCRGCLRDIPIFLPK